MPQSNESTKNEGAKAGPAKTTIDRTIIQKIVIESSIAVIADTKIVIKTDFSSYSKETFQRDLQFFYDINSGAANKPETIKSISPRYKKVFDSIKKYEFFFRPKVHDAIKKLISKSNKESFKTESKDDKTEPKKENFKTESKDDKTEPKKEEAKFGSFFRNFSWGSYEEFCWTCNRILSDEIEHAIENNFGLIIKSKKEVVFEIVVEDNLENDYQAAYSDDDSSETKVFLNIGGALLVGRIYGPWLFTKKADTRYLERTLNHELEHHVQHLRGLHQKEDEERDKLSKYAKENPDKLSGCAPVLHEIFCDLYSEGTAQFVNYQKAQKIVVDLKKLENSRNILLKIAQTKDETEAEKIWNEEFCPDSQSGEYYVGFIMCHIIGLGFLKQQQDIKSVKVVFPEKKEILFQELNKYINEKKVIHLARLNAKTFAETHSFLEGLNHYSQFINAFTKACNDLFLDGPLRVVDTKFCSLLKRTAMKGLRRRNVALLILFNSKKEILLQHRDDTAKALPGYWAFFGRGIKKGETPEQALRRESFEELCIKVKNPKIVAEQEFSGKHRYGKKYVFMEEINDSEIKRLVQKEGQGMGWYSIDDAKKLKICGHDLKVLEDIKDKY